MGAGEIIALSDSYNMCAGAEEAIVAVRHRRQRGHRRQDTCSLMTSWDD
jgi:hypothetical protein